jgi:hypothetical protein
MKQSEILHVSVCGAWCRAYGRYSLNNRYPSITCKENIIYKKNNPNLFKYWENGSKHPARKLDYITADEWLLLN